MSHVVYKYVLPIQDEIVLQSYELFRPLQIAEQYAGELCLWALVDVDSRRTKQLIRIYGTGHPIADPSPFKHYIGSVSMKCGLVWHVCHLGSIVE